MKFERSRKVSNCVRQLYSDELMISWAVIYLSVITLWYSALTSSRMGVQISRRNPNNSAAITFACKPGNISDRMFYYAVAFSLARWNRKQAFLQHCNSRICDQENCPRLQDIFHTSLLETSDLLPEQISPVRLNFNLNVTRDHVLPADTNALTRPDFPISSSFFHHTAKRIRQEFSFKDIYLTQANSILLKAKGFRRQAIFVGVLVQRKCEKRPASSFYKSAFRYFRMKYNNVVFVVVTDDPIWCKEKLFNSDVYVATGLNSTVDVLAVLSACNHSIFNQGGTGFWGAFLAGGETVYYVKEGLHRTGHNRQYPDHWIGTNYIK